LKVLSRIAPILIFIGTFALYVSTLAPGMLRGDSGEFQWAMASLNVAHATGYPLFTLIGYAWHWLPLDANVAWQLNLLAAFFGALAVAAVFVFIRALTARADAALIGAVFFAVAPVMWFNASILEVYPLHAFLLALVLYWLWRWSRAPQENGALYLAFFVLGLGLAHHRLMMLALPAILYFLIATDRRFFFNVPRLLLCALLVVPGLMLYAYVPLRMLPEGFSWDYAFNDIILGREYAGSLLREINPQPVLLEIPFHNFQAGLALALLGAVTLFRRARHLNIALWLVYSADVAFALVYSVPDVQVFLTSSFVVTAIWIGAGAAFLLEWIGQRVGSTYAPRLQIVYGVLLLLFALLGLARWNEIHAAVAAEAAPEARARAIAAMNLPPASFLELDWETATALRFLQSTEKLRLDLEVRLTHMDQRAEFWRALANVDAGRAVFIERGVNWTRAPAGYAVTARENDLAQLVRVPIEMTRFRASIGDRVEVVGYQNTPDAFVVYWRVKKALDKDLATYVHYLDAQGNKIAQDDRAACCEAVYGYRTREWEPGHIYADVFKPAPPDTARVVVGMYENLNGDIEEYGDALELKP
jgi:hypothetical protein